MFVIYEYLSQLSLFLVVLQKLSAVENMLCKEVSHMVKSKVLLLYDQRGT